MSHKLGNSHIPLRFIAVLIALVFLPTITASSKTNNLDKFAKCLNQKQATMYGSYLCPHCDDQKKMFGDSFQYINYVECSVPGSRQMSSVCQIAQIKNVPTWAFSDGSREVGVLPLKKLSEKTGCAIE